MKEHLSIRQDILFFSLVAIGGALGSIFRELMLPLLPSAISWLPILIINGLGSFIIGIVYGLGQTIRPSLRDFYTLGFCGGFSTFSHFIYQTYNYLEKGLFMSAFLDVLLSLSLVMLSVIAGFKLAKIFVIRFEK